MSIVTKIFIFSFLILILIFCFWRYGVSNLLADAIYYQIQTAEKNKDWRFVLKNYQAIFTLPLNEFAYQKEFAYSIKKGLIFYPEFKDKIKLLDYAIEHLERNAKKFPTFYFYYHLAPLYVEKAHLTLAPEDYNKAENNFIELKKISPLMPHFYENWILLEIYQSKLDIAIKLADEALMLLPNPNDPRSNKIHQQELSTARAEIEQLLGEIYYQKKEYERSLNSYRKSLKLNPFSNVGIYKRMADIYKIQKNTR
jgi:tetratricopeptide (TPR) repeat protein